MFAFGCTLTSRRFRFSVVMEVLAMAASNKPLLTLTAADLMSQTVVTVPQEMSLQAAAHLLSQAHVSGAPVVDDRGRCVGVLSATDFVHWADKGGRAARRGRAEVCVCAAWQI